MRALLHPKQSERLAHLRELGILDTEAESQFDEVVDLASKICDVPISLISLVDETRQWFKARVGLDAPQTDLDRSICSHVILQDDLVEISDTTQDVRTADNPLVMGEEHIRFYAGMPLISGEGLPIGTLCVLDTEPRVLTDLQRTTLRVLGMQLMRQIELRLALHQAAVLRDEIDHRVKNSLQTVASVVRMYKSRVDNAVAMNVCTVQVESSTAANIGMIVSEFTANAIKHAFPGGRRGTVAITVEMSQDHSNMHVQCRDNGIGNANPAEENEVTRLGQRLMQAAALQIGAEFTLEARADGYHLNMQVPMKDAPNVELAAE